MTSSESHQPSASFRENYYNVMYRHALKVTGSDKPARKLADRVYKELERRYTDNPVTSHIDAYLAAQVYLSYAQRGLGDSDGMANYNDTFPEAGDVSRFGNRPETAPTTQMTRNTDTSGSADKNPAPVSRSVENTPLQGVINASTRTEQTQTAEIKPNITAAPSAYATPPRDAAYYDKDSTIFWAPGMDSELPPKENHDEDQTADFPDFDFPKQKLPRHSVFFSILNALLGLCCIAAIALLLVELKILPELF